MYQLHLNQNVTVIKLTWFRAGFKALNIRLETKSGRILPLNYVKKYDLT